MGFLDDIKSKVGEENFEKAQSFISEKTSSSDEAKQGESQSGESQSTESSGSRYVDKLESYVGDEKINELKSKVGEANFTKGENFVEEQIRSRISGGSSNEDSN